MSTVSPFKHASSPKKTLIQTSNIKAGRESPVRFSHDTQIEVHEQSINGLYGGASDTSDLVGRFKKAAITT